MSKILYICYRNDNDFSAIEKKAKKICDDINADNISPNPTISYQRDKVVYGISNPVSTLNVNGRNILLGKLFNDEENWQSIKEDYPDGNYAIFRSNENFIEVVTDILGTRTVWYYKDDDIFISSTSQRAIVKFLGDFQFDERVIPWMISSGSLGPQYSWDKRIKRIQPGFLLLDRNSWNLKESINKVDFSLDKPNYSDAQYEESLRNSLNDTFKELEFDFTKWALSFSGGHDCRGILGMMDRTKKPSEKIKTVTWGVKGAEKEKNTDAEVAKVVTRKFNTEHIYFPTDSSKESAETIISRFLRNGEGRIDHFSGYTDGFQIWKTLFENQIEGVIRGNQVFGQKEPHSALAVRSFIGIPLCSDFQNIQKFEYINSLEQEIPSGLDRKEGESLSSWRDRLLQEYRLPVVQASLSDLKFPYVEQFDPLLSKKIIYQVRSMPDHLRNEKSLYQKIVRSLNPGLKYASKNATEEKKKIVIQKEYVALIKRELSSENAENIFPKDFLLQVKENMKVERKKRWLSLSSIKRFVSSKIPLRLKKKIYRKVMTPSLDINTLAFRLVLVSKMYRLLNEERRSGGE